MALIRRTTLTKGELAGQPEHGAGHLSPAVRKQREASAAPARVGALGTVLHTFRVGLLS